MANILPSSIATAPHLNRFDGIAADRFAALPLDAVLVYLIDTVSASALPLLAEQFDVLGYKGYKLAASDAERREIIKRAIELKRHIGTVWAVREALSAAGISSSASIVEGVGVGPTGWAVFRVEISLGDTPVSGTVEDEAARLINEYKNVRSHLQGITFTTDVSDTLVIPDDILDYLLDSGDEEDEIVHEALYYDGTWRLDGTYNYDGYKDESLLVTII